MQRMLVRVAVEMTSAVGALSDKIIVRSSPAVQSCLRLGLPADYLYHS